MKIFLSFLQSPTTHPIPAYSFWEYYIKNGIKESGHNWIEESSIDWALGLVPQSKESFLKWKENSWKKTITYLKKNGADLFLSYLYPEQIDTESIREIKKMGIPCVNFFCDNIREYRKVPVEFGVFDLNWVPEYQAIDLYQKQKFKCIHLPMPMWVEPKYRNVSENESSNISFVGSKDIQRQLLFENFIKIKPSIEIDIYGSGWEQNSSSSFQFERKTVYERIFGQRDFIYKNGLYAFVNKLTFPRKEQSLSAELKRYIRSRPDFENYIKITRESQITLGINRYPSFHYPLNSPNTYSRLRDIEAPMLGACYLTELAPGIESIYEIGKEVEVYSSIEEMKSKIISLQKDVGRRKILRKYGQQAALTRLSIPQSLNKITKVL